MPRMTADERQAFGWGWRTVIHLHPDDAEKRRSSSHLQLKWELCLASGEAAEVEARHRRFDGTYRWFLCPGRIPLRDESGKVVKWYGTNIDMEKIASRQMGSPRHASETQTFALSSTPFRRCRGRPILTAPSNFSVSAGWALQASLKNRRWGSAGR